MPIPNEMPPFPGAPIGWTPNQLMPTPAIWYSQMNAQGQNLGIYAVGGIYTATFSPTIGQIQSANTVPIQFLSGQSGAIILPISWSIQQQMAGTLWSVAPQLRPVYRGNTTGLLGTITLTNTINITKFQIETSLGVSAIPNNFVLQGTGIDIFGAADRTGGTSAVYRIVMTYAVIAGLI